MTGRRTGRRRGAAAAAPARQVDYHNLRNPFPPAPAFPDDRVAAIHDAALQVLEELGIKILLPEARQLFAQAGARVEDDMVFIGRDIVEATLATAPRSFTLRAGTRKHDILLELGRVIFLPGGGAPNVSDLIGGRRPGSLQDFQNLTRIAATFEALQTAPGLIEPQDIPVHLRHYATMRTVLNSSDKVPFTYARGTGQVMDCFEMMRDFRGLSDDEFRAAPHQYTIINTNSPRMIDVPMAQGLIDFARFGQMAVVTPFTLMGAMAPITVAGALTLSHAEALAGIALSQLARPGAPVAYGTFTSNVDMKSGAPAMGTPEQVKASLGAGQLARLLGLPWRCAAGSAANINDAQAAHETEISGWGALLAGATIIVHSAGWLESGLTVSYEKLITDMEMVQVMAELCADTPASDDDIALDALREVPPGGHFFGAAHTMARYKTEFYEPLAADWSNFGTWTEHGAIDANTRATGIWQRILHEFQPPDADPDRLAALDDFIARRTAEGGAPPES